jgi:hypothetical protein
MIKSADLEALEYIFPERECQSFLRAFYIFPVNPILELTPTIQLYQGGKNTVNV